MQQRKIALLSTFFLVFLVPTFLIADGEQQNKRKRIVGGMVERAGRLVGRAKQVIAGTDSKNGKGEPDTVRVRVRLEEITSSCAHRIVTIWCGNQCLAECAATAQNAKTRKTRRGAEHFHECSLKFPICQNYTYKYKVYKVPHNGGNRITAGQNNGHSGRIGIDAEEEYSSRSTGSTGTATRGTKNSENSTGSRNKSETNSGDMGKGGKSSGNGTSGNKSSSDGSDSGTTSTGSEYIDVNVTANGNSKTGGSSGKQGANTCGSYGELIFMEDTLMIVPREKFHTIDEQEMAIAIAPIRSGGSFNYFCMD